MSIVKILHVPDLHFNRDEGKQPLQGMDETDIINFFTNQEQISAILVTGDLTSKGKQEGLEKAFTFLQKLRAIFNNPPTLISPGNHDVTWATDLNQLKKMSSKSFLEDSKRFDTFLDCYKNVNSDPNYIRPLLCSKEFQINNLKRPLEEYIRQNCDRAGLSPDDRDHLPFYWLQDQRVFFYVLSSVDLSGTPYSPRDYKLSNLINETEKLPDSDLKKYLINESFQRDIPYISFSQLLAMKYICQKLAENKKTTEKFKYSLKIVAFHHPIVSLPIEEEIKEFDGIINGSTVAKYLTDLKFSILFYGHKHKHNKAINFGNWNNNHEIGELATIAGGKIFDRSEQHGKSFQILTVSDENQERYNARHIKLSTYDIPSDLTPQEYSFLCSEIDGRPKWIHLNRRKILYRNHEINKKFYVLVNSIESAFKASTVDQNNWKEGYRCADDFLGQFMDFINDFSKGSYGVNDAYLAQMRDDLKQVSKCYFIDVLGSPAWAHPDLMAHLAIQLKEYMSRNHLILDNKWKYSTEIMQAIQRVCGTSKESDGAFLDLEICRILIWPKEQLFKITGQILVKLHQLFDIPLFYLEPNHAAKIFNDYKTMEYNSVVFIDGIKKCNWYNNVTGVREYTSTQTATINHEKLLSLLKSSDLCWAEKALSSELKRRLEK